MSSDASETGNTRWHALTAADALRKPGCEAAGLSSHEAAGRLARCGVSPGNSTSC